MMISAFFDESGKFKDHSTISFAGIAGVAADFNALGDEWRRHLRLNGLQTLTMKRALNAGKPLSEKRAAKGITNRVDALTPFMECIRKNVPYVISIAVDVEAFKRTPSHLRQVWGDDPHLMAFTRTLLDVIKPLELADKINVICDDEESVALEMYRLYRRVKIVNADAKIRLASLSFADDTVFHPLQAADFVASLARLEARQRFHQEAYEYGAVWEGLSKPRETDRLWEFGSIYVGSEELRRLAEGELNLRRKKLKQIKHP